MHDQRGDAGRAFRHTDACAEISRGFLRNNSGLFANDY